MAPGEYTELASPGVALVQGLHLRVFRVLGSGRLAMAWLWKSKHANVHHTSAACSRH